jgi:hypothetical protein
MVQNTENSPQTGPAITADKVYVSQTLTIGVMDLRPMGFTDGIVIVLRDIVDSATGKNVLESTEVVGVLYNKEELRNLIVALIDLDKQVYGVETTAGSGIILPKGVN